MRSSGAFSRALQVGWNALLGMNRQHVAHANRTYIQADPEGGMRHETSKPGLRWIGRSRRSNAESERWLHEEEWHQYCTNTKEQGGQQSGAREPAT